MAALVVVGIVAVPTAAFAATSTISGVVHDPNGAAAPFAGVIAWDADTGARFDSDSDGTYNETTGAYTIPVPRNADYRVQFMSTYEYKIQFFDGIDTDDPLNEAITPVHVGTTNVTGIDATLTYGGPASVSVTTSASEGSLNNVHLTLERYNADLDVWDFVADEYPQGAGTTTFSHLPVGQYRVSGSAGPGFDPVDNAAVTFAGDVGTLGLQFQAIPSATISGMVSDAAGPINQVQISIYLWDSTDSLWQELEIATGEGFTDATGHYTVTVPQNGDYSLFFNSVFTDSDASSVFLNGTASQPANNASAGVVHVTTTNQTANIVLPASAKVTGKVVKSAGGAALAGATITVFHRNGTTWESANEVISGSDGKFSVNLQSGQQYTFRVGKPGYKTVFLGGGTTLPAVPDATNSRTLTTATTALPNFALEVKVSSLGRFAGQNLSYCKANALVRNDDSFTINAVPLPFDINFFGEEYSEIFVNNNGNVTFTEPRQQYTPSDLTGALGFPIIAPFFADIDTRNLGSAVVTYGASPDGKSFCVNWADVGYFNTNADKLDTVQLVLTTRTSVVGRDSGDFDITFNYDEVSWETGDVSGGLNGFGGTSAAVGFSAGTGNPGTYLQLPGSFVNGALLDGGANSLTANKVNSTQDGRYVFEVRNDGSAISYGSVSGHVENESGAPIENAYIEASRPGRSYYTQTDSAGNYSLPAVSAGDYALYVTGPSGTFAGDVGITVTASTLTAVPTIVLRAPVGIQSNPDISLGSAAFNYSDAGVPAVYFGDAIPFSIAHQCLGATASVSVVVGGETRTTALVEHVDGATSTYAASMPALYPLHGDGVVTITVTCPSEAPVDHTFDIYIDPSGIIVDQYGNPVQGATVTLLRSTTETGTYTAVPNGSSIMSPSNRVNPDTTGSDGRFNWDVTPAWYKVKVAKSGSTAVTTAAMQVPPARTELVIKLTVPGAKPPVPTVAPSLSGADTLSSTLILDPGSWGPDISIGTVTWRVGTAIKGTGLTHVIGAGEVSKLTATIQGTRTVVGNEQGLAGSPLSYTFPFTVVVGTQKFTKSPTPTISGTPKIGGVLTAKPGTWAPTGATFTYEWYVNGTLQPFFSGSSFKPAVDDFEKAVTVKVIAHKPGWADKTSALSKPTAAVGKGDVLTTTPVIAGTVRVGEELSAVAGGWGPPAANPTLSYQWYRDGKVIPIVGSDATDGTYELVGLDYGKKITVKVTGTPTGPTADRFVAKYAASAATGKVAVATLTTTDTPVITGDAEVGSTLGVDVGTWDPAPTSFKYQWYLGTKAISRATTATYKVPATALGKTIYVKLTSVKLGYTAVVKNSDPVTIAPGDFDVKPIPTILGVAKTGATLSVDVGSWEGTGNTFLYQWMIDGSMITAEQKPTFKITDLMFGDEITVKVWATNTGYTGSGYSDPSAPVIPVHALTVIVPKITGTARVGNTLTATLGTWANSPSLNVRWIAYKPGVETVLQEGVVAGTSDTLFLLDTAGTRGATIRVEVTATKTDYHTEVVLSAPTKKVP